MPGRNEDVVWRCFEKSKAEGKNYYVGKCKACSVVVSGVCLTSWPMLTMYSFAGITERLRAHANECDKLQEMKLWEATDDPKSKKPRTQKVLTFGATNIEVLKHFLHAFPHSYPYLRWTNLSAKWGGSCIPPTHRSKLLKARSLFP